MNEDIILLINDYAVNLALKNMVKPIENFQRKKPPSYFKTLLEILKVLINFFYGDKLPQVIFTESKTYFVSYL